MSPSDPYHLSVARSAAHVLSEKLPEKVASAVYEFITGPLLENPHGVGKPLDPPLATPYSARRGVYRVLYLIDESTRTVRVTAFSHRSDVYGS